MKSNMSVLLILFIITTSCSERNPSPVRYSKIGKNDKTVFVKKNKLLSGEAPLNFASLQKYILKPKCISCHSGSDSKPTNDPIDFSSYENMMVKRDIKLFSFTRKDSKRSRFYRSLIHIDIEKRMPLESKRLTEVELNFIQDWIASCAQKNIATEVPINCNVQTEQSDEDDWDDGWDDEGLNEDYGNDWINGNDWVGWIDMNNINNIDNDFGNDWLNGNDWVGWFDVRQPVLNFGNDWLNGNDWVGWKK
jgi:hypothetical protein